MICISFGQPSVPLCRDLLEPMDPRKTMAEIRLDGAELSGEEVRRIFGLHANLVATCRPTPDRTRAQRQAVLIAAIEAGAAWVDVELEAGNHFKQDIARAAREKGCRLIVSYHNFETTPDRDELEGLMARCFDAGAGVAKIVCTVHTPVDSARMLSLYSRPLPAGVDFTGKPFGLVALGMGEQGKITRIAAPFLGAPFTFASIPGQQETAPGQLDLNAMEQVYRLIQPSRNS